MAERAKLYKSNLSEIEFRERITFLIQEHSSVEIKGHVKQFNYHRKEKIFGKLERDKFWIWKQGFFSGGIFYPIFYGAILDSTKELKIQMNSKPNALGSLFFVFLSFFVVISVIVWLLFFQEFSSLYQKIGFAILGLCIIGFFQFLPNLTYTISKRKFRQFLEKELQMIRIN